MEFSTDKISLYEIDDKVWVNCPQPIKGIVLEIFERPHVWLYKVDLGKHGIKEFIEDDIFRTRECARDQIKYRGW